MRQLFTALLVVGFVGAYFWWIAAAAAVAGLIWLAIRGCEAVRAYAAEDARCKAALIADADRQHAWALIGDPRGTYGDYSPSI